MPCSPSILLKRAVLFFVAFCLLTVWTGAALAGQTVVDPRPIIEELIKEYVKKRGDHGIKVVGLGSWIKGGKYRNPLLNPADPSDHDMTLFMDSDDTAKMQKEWRNFQNYMKRGLEDKIPAKDAKAVLKSVNIYPPDQLTDDIIDQSDAVAKYQKLAGTPGGTPNLGGEPVEGIWGSGKRPYVQSYSSTNGRTFYKDAKGVVRKGFSDLDNLAAGYGKFTGYNTARLSSQWADKAVKSMQGGRPAETIKYLERLNQSLRKSKSMAGLRGSALNNPELLDAMADYKKAMAKVSREVAAATEKAKKLGQTLSDDQVKALTAKLTKEGRAGWLDKNRKLINQALEYGQMESAYCRMVARGGDDAALYLKQLKGPRLRKFLRSVSKTVDGARKMGVKGFQTLGKVPWGKVLKFAAALAVAAEAHNIASVYNEKGMDAALKQANLTAILTLFPPNIVGQMILEYGGTELGYDLVTSQQGCLNLVAGVYEVKGREQSASGSQIAKLAENYADAEKVQEVVAIHARRASHKGLKKESAADREAAEAVAGRLIAKCTGVVLDAWQRERLRLLALALAQKYKLDAKMSRSLPAISLSTRPSGKGQVEVSASFNPGGSRQPYLEMLRKLDSRIKALGGKGKLGGLLVTEDYIWQVRRYQPGDGRGKWGPWKEVSRNSYRVYINRDKMPFFGWRRGATFKLNKGYHYEVGLSYALKERPDPDLDFMAPEVKDNLRDLWQRYAFNPVARLDTAFAKLAIQGPAKLLLGQRGTLTSEIKGAQELEPGAKLLVAWINPQTGKEVGTGPSLNLKREQGPGKFSIQAVLYQVKGSQRQALARASHSIEFLAPASLRFTALDRETRQPLPGARWDLKGPASFSRGPAAVIEIAPMPAGTYQVVVRAPGYHGLKGPLTLEAGGDYRKVAPLRKMEQTDGLRPAPAAKAKPAPSKVKPGGMSPQEICSCYERLYLKQNAARSAKDQVLVVSPMVWDPQNKKCTGLYRLPPPYTSVKKGVKGPAQWRVSRSLNRAQRECERAEKAAGKSAAPKKAPCKYTMLKSFQGLVAQSVLAGKNAPAQKEYSLALPGPGTVKITTTVSGRHQMANTEYGSKRFLSIVSWSSPDGAFKKGHMRGGEFYPGVRDVGSNTGYLKVAKAGGLRLKFKGESCYRSGKDYKGKPVCYQCCEAYGKYGLIMLPTKFKIKVEFQPVCEEKRP